MKNIQRNKVTIPKQWFLPLVTDELSISVHNITRSMP